METKKITSLLSIGQLALELHAANNAASWAKVLYHEAIDCHEKKNGHIVGSINPREPRYAGVIAATKVEYEAYQATKRVAYNIKRRLESACRRPAC